MGEMRVVPGGSPGRCFVPPEFLPAGTDEQYLRNAQFPRPDGYWRPLRTDEIDILVKDANVADNWDNVLVTEQFSPRRIKNCEFHGLVRIGRLEDACLEFHDMQVPVGLTNSRIISCDLGDDVAIHDVRYLAHYIVGDNVILLNLDEMTTTNHAKFGNGIVKDGEDESVRITIDLVNEAGGRAVMPFDGMTSGDAYLWAKYRSDAQLMSRLGEMTQRTFDSRRGFYGVVGDRCVIKNSGVLKDVKIGPCAYINGANKLKNLTINSSPEEPTQIGEGVELVNGIIGRGCHIFYGCKAVRFVMGDNSALKYGARLIHSYLGDNSTVSCCEMLHNLIFPAHEQHHNNSFLIASLVMGQSNIAAGATIGSNHNSRAPDGEIQAGRGFWPGLCVSVKHNCRFASFVLLAKGDYPYELDIALPFSLVSNSADGGSLQILPSYWWLYNMYALSRNTWKFQARDRRRHKTQKIEFDSLAPDTAEEMFAGMRFLEVWTAKVALRRDGKSPEGKQEGELAAMGRQLLTAPAEKTEGLEVLAEGAENSARKTVVLKARAGYHAYREMLHYYAVKNLLAYMKENPSSNLAGMCRALAGQRRRDWVNLGGQIVWAEDLEQIKADVKSGGIDTWTAMHEACDRLWAGYPLDKQRHAFATLLDLLGVRELTVAAWTAAMEEAGRIQQTVAERTYTSRKKDYDNPFRRITYQTEAEMKAVVGTAEEDGFVKQVRRETDEFLSLIDSVGKRG